MANTASAKKRIRSNARRTLRNQMIKTRVRTAIRNARASLSAADPDEIKQAMQAAISELDRAAEKGVIHKNNAARRKSRLMKRWVAASRDE